MPVIAIIRAGRVKSESVCVHDKGITYCTKKKIGIQLKELE